MWICGLRIYSLRIYSLRIYNLNNGRGLVRILICGVRNLGCGGIAVRNLSVGCILASKVSSEAAWVCRANSVEWVSYKAGDPVKFEGGKEAVGFDVI